MTPLEKPWEHIFLNSMEGATNPVRDGCSSAVFVQPFGCIPCSFAFLEPLRKAPRTQYKTHALPYSSCNPLASPPWSGHHYFFQKAPRTISWHDTWRRTQTTSIAKITVLLLFLVLKGKQIACSSLYENKIEKNDKSTITCGERPESRQTHKHTHTHMGSNMQHVTLYCKNLSMSPCVYVLPSFLPQHSTASVLDIPNKK